jgi:hypothetical protein
MQPDSSLQQLHLSATRPRPAPARLARTEVSNQLIALSHYSCFLLAGKLILKSNFCEYQISAKQIIACVDSRLSARVGWG